MLTKNIRYSAAIRYACSCSLHDAEVKLAKTKGRVSAGYYDPIQANEKIGQLEGQIVLFKCIIEECDSFLASISFDK